MKYAADKEMDFEARQIRESLELSAVPEMIDRKLRQVYAELPEEVPTRKRPKMGRVWKSALGTVSALAAAFVLLLGVNGLNPALAEGLPLVGGIFRLINNTQGWANLDTTQSAVQQYAEPIEGVEVQVPAGGLLEKPMTVAVREAYFDGEFLYAGLTMKIDEKVGLYNKVFPGFDILINGDSMIGYNEGGGRGYDAEGFAVMDEIRPWVYQESGVYISQVAFRVPEQYQELEQVEITLQYNGIQVYNSAWDTCVNSTPFSLSFTVERNDVQSRRIDSDLEVNGIRLVSAVATPAGSAYTVDFSDRYVHAPYLGATASHGPQFEDGCALGARGRVVPQILENGMTRETTIFGGVQESDSRKVVYTVFDKNGSHEYEAVFILDFQNGTAEIGTVDDIVEFRPSTYTCPDSELKDFSGQHKIAYASLKEGGNHLLIMVETKDIFSRAMGVEVWQDDALLGARIEQVEIRENDPVGGRKYTFGLLGMEILDASKPVTVKLYDASSGEKMLEETICLSPNQK